jgi:hypothetical protein
LKPGDLAMPVASWNIEMRVLRANLAVLLLGLMTAGNAIAGDNLWLGVKAGTLGVGLEATWRPIPWMDLRLGGSVYDFDDDGSQAGINYNATLGLENYYLNANFLFPVSPFRITVGGYSNGNELQMTSMDAANFDVGNGIYDLAEVGTLQSTTFFEGIAPYLGVGFDFSLFGKVGMNLDFGVLWQGDPNVSLTADGTAATDPILGPIFLADLEAERQQLETEFEDYKAYPVASLGFSFNFF